MSGERRTFSGKPSGQKEAELLWLLGAIQARNVRRYLEVGARFGDTLVRVADAMAPGGLLVAVDLPGAAWGRRHSEIDLEAAADYARSRGHEVHVFLGSSHDEVIVAQVEDLGPYDLGLIDADHTLKAVTQDVANYGPFCDAIALHDISLSAPPTVDVPLLWQALRAVAPASSSVAPGSGMGLGIVECAR